MKNKKVKDYQKLVLDIGELVNSKTSDVFTYEDIVSLIGIKIDEFYGFLREEK